MVDGFQDARARRSDTGTDENLAIGAGQNGDIATGALDDGNIAKQLAELDGRHRDGVADEIHDVAWLGVGRLGPQPIVTGGKARGNPRSRCRNHSVTGFRDSAKTSRPSGLSS